MGFTPEFRGHAEMLIDIFIESISNKKNLENILRFYHVDKNGQYLYMLGYYHGSAEAEISNAYLMLYKRSFGESDLDDMWEIIKRREKEVDEILTRYGIETSL